MRRIVGILKWLGVSGSALLFVATLILWGRGVGHVERWTLDRFEPEPRWTSGPRAGWGTMHWCTAWATHGRLWLEWYRQSPAREFESEMEHQRQPVTADEAKLEFESSFRSRRDSEPDGSFEQAWKGAGVGFRHERGYIDPQTGRPPYEAFVLALPFWLLALVLGAGPGAVLARRLLRQRRDAPHLCPTCGYDLRATPDPSGPKLKRCPECGREPAQDR